MDAYLIMPWGEWFAALQTWLTTSPDAVPACIVAVVGLGMVAGGGIGAAIDDGDGDNCMFFGAMIGMFWPAVLIVLLLFAAGWPFYFVTRLLVERDNTTEGKR